MRISVKGPASELEAEAKKKLITENDIKSILKDDNITKKNIERAILKTRDLISFYDRIIRSINETLKRVSNNTQIDFKEKKTLIKKQERDLSQAKREKIKFRKYLNELNSLL